MAFAGDVANFVIGGIPGDIHDILNPDVVPGDLQRASTAMADVADSVASVHLHLNDSVELINGRWVGSGATAFETDIWQPLSDGLDVLERESHNAAHQLANLASQAAEAHLQKITAIEQEVQTQLNITAVTWELTPAAGRALAETLSGVASRLGADLVNQIVAGITRAIEELIKKLLSAFADLFGKALDALPFAEEVGNLQAVVRRLLPGNRGAEVAGDEAAADAWDAGGAAVSISDLDPATIGTEGANPSIRQLPGGRSAAQDFFDKYSRGGTDSTPPGFGGAAGGQQVTMPDGTVMNIRYVSASGDPAVTVNNAYGYWKIHFGQ